MAFLQQLHSFDKSGLKQTDTVVRPLPIVCSGLETSGLNCLGGKIEAEQRDPIEKIKEHAKEFARLLQAAKHAIVYTGAGISTSTGIADYRGPNGVWTCLATGRIPDETIDAKDIMPSYTHMCIKKLCDLHYFKFVTSTNLDGLHWRSGLKPLGNLSELHGNMYCMRCPRCKAEFYESSPVTRTPNRFQDQWCDCGGNLMDSGIDFGQTLPLQHLALAEKNAKKADLSLVIGTSMRVKPASTLPLMNPETNLCILNLMKTPFDEQAALRSFCDCDDFFYYLMQELGLSPDSPPTTMPASFNTFRA